VGVDAERFGERGPDAPAELAERVRAPGTHWLNVAGLDEGTVGAVAEAIGLHPLTLGDVLHVGQRPQVEEYDAYLFVVLRMLTVRNVAVPPTPVASANDRFTELNAKGALPRTPNRVA